MVVANDAQNGTEAVNQHPSFDKAEISPEPDSFAQTVGDVITDLRNWGFTLEEMGFVEVINRQGNLVTVRTETVRGNSRIGINTASNEVVDAFDHYPA